MTSGRQLAEVCPSLESESKPRNAPAFRVFDLVFVDGGLCQVLAVRHSSRCTELDVRLEEGEQHPMGWTEFSIPAEKVEGVVEHQGSFTGRVVWCDGATRPAPDSTPLDSALVARAFQRAPTSMRGVLLDWPLTVGSVRRLQALAEKFG